MTINTNCSKALGLILAVAALPAFSMTDPFCDPGTIFPDGDLECNNRGGINMPLDQGPSFDSHGTDYDLLNSWFELSVDNASLATGDEVTVVEVRAATLFNNVVGSIVLRRIDHLFGFGIGNSQPLFEVFWRGFDPISGASFRTPTQSEMLFDDVPLLDDFTVLCVNIDIERTPNGFSGSSIGINISESGDPASSFVRTVNLDQGNVYNSLIMAHGGLVIGPQFPGQASGTVSFVPRPYANCQGGPDPQ